MKPIRRGVYLLLALLLLLVSALVFPSAAQATSIYDTTYQSTATLVQKGNFGCSDQDITYTWPNYLINDEHSGVKESFALAKSQGRWGVSVSYGQVIVFWTEDTSLYLDWTDPVYGGGYSVMAKGNNVHRAEFSLSGYYYPKPCMPYVSSYSTDFGAQMVISDKFDYTKNLFVMTDYPNYPSGYEGALLVTSEPKAQYVALGDSFSTAEGNPSFEAGTDVDGTNECHRSPLAYPRLLQSELDLGPTAFVACSGASTNDILGMPENGDPHGKWNEPAQIDALSADTEVVTITVGGNDVKFKEFAEKCLSPVSTLTLDEVCDEYTDIYDEVTGLIANSLPAKLENVYANILDEAPNAEIYVGGYPLIAPFKYIDDPFDQDCGGLYDEFPNTWGDARAAYEVVNLLNATIENAVNTVNNQESSTRLHYVDVSEGAFAGHDACESDSYFNGIDIYNPEYSIHPNADGHVAYFEEFEEMIS